MHRDAVIFVIHPDAGVRESLRQLLEEGGFRVAACGTAEEFASGHDGRRIACIIVSEHLLGEGETGVLARLRAGRTQPPVIVVSSHPSIPRAVRAMRAGAFDVLKTPVAGPNLLASVRGAIEKSRAVRDGRGEVEAFLGRVNRLTPRQRQVMDLLVEGRSNKEIASALGLSAKTVEIHRARVMARLEVPSLASLVALAVRGGLDAGGAGGGGG